MRITNPRGIVSLLLYVDYHDKFLRGEPNLACNIKRPKKGAAESSKKKQSSPDDDARRSNFSVPSSTRELALSTGLVNSLCLTTNDLNQQDGQQHPPQQYEGVPAYITTTAAATTRTKNDSPCETVYNNIYPMSSLPLPQDFSCKDDDGDDDDDNSSMGTIDEMPVQYTGNISFEFTPV